MNKTLRFCTAMMMTLLITTSNTFISSEGSQALPSLNDIYVNNAQPSDADLHLTDDAILFEGLSLNKDLSPNENLSLNENFSLNQASTFNELQATINNSTSNNSTNSITSRMELRIEILAGFTFENTINVPLGSSITLYTDGNMHILIAPDNARHFNVEGTLNLQGGIVLMGNGGNGGGVLNNGTLNMSGSSSISTNQAILGGAVQMTSNNSVMTMSESASIMNNTATNLGGGIFVGGTNSTFTMYDGEISNNHANTGGGIHAETGSFVHIESGFVVNNIANQDGGGINARSLENLTVGIDTFFADNYAFTAVLYRNPADDAIYYQNILGTNWTHPFTQGYNNFDIGYQFDEPYIPEPTDPTTTEPTTEAPTTTAPTTTEPTTTAPTTAPTTQPPTEEPTITEPTTTAPTTSTNTTQPTTDPPSATTTTPPTTTQPSEPDEPDTDEPIITPPTTAPQTTSPTTAPSTTEPTTPPITDPTTPYPTEPNTEPPTADVTTPNGSDNDNNAENDNDNDSYTNNGDNTEASPNIPPSIQDPNNELVEDYPYWWELDEQGVPLGRWEWDDIEEMWLFNDDVPLAYFPFNTTEQQEQDVMSRTGVGGLALYVYVMLIGSIAVAAVMVVGVRRYLVSVRDGE